MVACWGATLAVTFGGSVGVANAATGEFVTQANAICTRTTKAVRALGRPAPAELAAYLRKSASIGERQYRQIGELTPPKSARADVDKALQIGHRGLRIFRQTADQLAGASDPKRVVQRMSRRVEPLARREDRLWSAIGVDKCAS
jgi:hypothetical protein